MKIDLASINPEFFNIKEGLIGDETCFLVTPKQLNTPWDVQNKYFRSSIWNKDGELVSGSFFKFPNWLERPDVFPVPESLKGTTAVLKIDGSALIISKYKGQLVHRTRGTFDASLLSENGNEIELFKKKYPEVFDLSGDETWDVSYVFEWVSPKNPIVINYQESELYLIGMISHSDYSLYGQYDLNEIAKFLGVKRPESHTFTDIPDMLETVKKWEGKEGIVLYSGRGQILHKIKAEKYLIAHHFKSNATLENTIDLFIDYKYPSYSEFEKKLTEQFDEDCKNMVLGFCGQICDAYQKVTETIEEMKHFVSPLFMVSRKCAAENIIKRYGTQSSFVFEILDHNRLSDKSLKKMLYTLLSK